MNTQMVPGPGGVQYILPSLPPQSYKTYRLAAPPDTHFRKATCAEVDCQQYLNGWRIRVEGLTAQQIRDIRVSGRKYTVERVAEGETWVVFEAGQPCFRAAAHRARTDRPPAYLIAGGDWRGNPDRVKPRLLSAPSWQDDFGEHQERIAERIKRGEYNG